MAVVHRKISKTNPSRLEDSNFVAKMEDEVEKGKHSRTNKIICLAPCGIVFVLMVLAVWMGIPSTSGNFLKQQVVLSTDYHNMLLATTKPQLRWTQEMTNGITVTVVFNGPGTTKPSNNLKKDAQTVSLGPHTVQVAINKNIQPNCEVPKFSIRWVGSGLVFVHLMEQSEGIWSGRFSFPLVVVDGGGGEYRMETKFYGCHHHPNENQPQQPASYENAETVLSLKTAAVVLDSAPSIVSLPEKSLFPDSYWKQLSSSSRDYLWSNQETEGTNNDPLVKTSDSAVSIHSATTKEHGFYKFSELGNYELLCFLGNATMQEIRREFMELRPKLFSAQRPFKFHFYPMAGFFHKPDRYWSTDDKKRLRKCKHILVNLEELEDDLSQHEYREQLTTFVGHLLKLMDDSTFPIRLFTWMQPPAKATACHHPYLPRTTDHPCNDVLKSLFVPTTTTTTNGTTTTVFPNRVKLLDNTDITLPLLEKGAAAMALANVALRVYVVAGEQVSAWRAVGQHGLVDGLHRNGKVEPNFKLVPYEGWN